MHEFCFPCQLEPLSWDLAAGVGSPGTQLVPVHPLLARIQALELDECLPQERALPESPLAQYAKVDHSLLQVSPRDPVIHKLWEGVSEILRSTESRSGKSILRSDTSSRSLNCYKVILLFY